MIVDGVISTTNFVILETFAGNYIVSLPHLPLGRIISEMKDMGYKPRYKFRLTLSKRRHPCSIRNS